MCGRYTLRHTTDQIAMRFGVEEPLVSISERYNIAPSQPVAAVMEREGVRVLDACKWGLVPSWAKDPAIGNKMINARAETLAEKPSYKQALLRRRCIVPSDGFYEWKQENGQRQPMFIHREDDALFGFAGLWEEWRQGDGPLLRTCTIITVAPNELMTPIHNRMPAILRQEDEALWLDSTLRDVNELLHVLQPYSAALEAFAVSRRVNAPTLDDPSCLLAVS